MDLHLGLECLSGQRNEPRRGIFEEGSAQNFTGHYEYIIVGDEKVEGDVAAFGIAAATDDPAVPKIFVELRVLLLHEVVSGYYECSFGTEEVLEMFLKLRIE